MSVNQSLNEMRAGPDPTQPNGICVPDLADGFGKGSNEGSFTTISFCYWAMIFSTARCFGMGFRRANKPMRVECKKKASREKPGYNIRRELPET